MELSFERPAYNMHEKCKQTKTPIHHRQGDCPIKCRFISFNFAILSYYKCANNNNTFFDTDTRSLTFNEKTK